MISVLSARGCLLVFCSSANNRRVESGAERRTWRSFSLHCQLSFPQNESFSYISHDRLSELPSTDFLESPACLKIHVLISKTCWSLKWMSDNHLVSKWTDFLHGYREICEHLWLPIYHPDWCFRTRCTTWWKLSFSTSSSG